MNEKPVISISDFDDKKVVSFHYLEHSESKKLSLLVECDKHNTFKIYIDSRNPYIVFSIDDSGHAFPEFSNVK